MTTGPVGKLKKGWIDFALTVVHSTAIIDLLINDDFCLNRESVGILESYRWHHQISCLVWLVRKKKAVRCHLNQIKAAVTALQQLLPQDWSMTWIISLCSLTCCLSCLRQSWRLFPTPTSCSRQMAWVKNDTDVLDKKVNNEQLQGRKTPKSKQQQQQPQSASNDLGPFTLGWYYNLSSSQETPNCRFLYKGKMIKEHLWGSVCQAGIWWSSLTSWNRPCCGVCHPDRSSIIISGL